VQLVNLDNVSPIVMGQIPLEGLVMGKRQAALRTHAIQGGM
jgi:hypothetical protein